jgi:hypothetical protein
MVGKPIDWPWTPSEGTGPSESNPHHYLIAGIVAAIVLFWVFAVWFVLGVLGSIT